MLPPGQKPKDNRDVKAIVSEPPIEDELIAPVEASQVAQDRWTPGCMITGHLMVLCMWTGEWQLFFLSKNFMNPFYHTMICKNFDHDCIFHVEKTV